MAFGKPSISDPADASRAVAMAVSNTRQRIEAIEAALNTLTATTQQSSFTQNSNFSASISALSIRLNALADQVAALEAATTDTTKTYIAGEAIGTFEPVVEDSPGTVLVADPTDPVRNKGFVGITVNSATVGQAIEVQTSGTVTIDGAGFTPNELVYVGTSTGGHLTQDSSEGNYLLEVGVALSSTILLILPGASGLISALAASGDGILAKNGTSYSGRELIEPAAGITIANSNGVAGDPTFALANDLLALEDLSTTGFAARIDDDVWATRILIPPVSGFDILFSSGIAGDPTFELNDDLLALEDLSAAGIAVRTGTSTWDLRSLVQPAAGITITAADGVAGDPTFALANDLAAVEALSGTGIAVRTGTDAWAQRSLAQPAAGITITNPAGVAGNPTFALANDLAALEGLSGTGFATRTGVDTWAQRSLTQPAAGITITNPAGVAGDPTFALANDLAALEGLTGTGFARRTGVDTWALASSVSLTADVSGVLPIANGGSGQSTANDALNAFLPAQTGNSGKFLTTDGTNASWGTAGAGTVTSVSVVTANGVSGSVATATTTPAITLTLGAITPTSVAATTTISGTDITANGNLTISGNARLIKGLFDGTAANRTFFQTSTANTTTSLGIIPSGSGTSSILNFYNSSSISGGNYSQAQISIDTASFKFNTAAVGSGTLQPMVFAVNGSEKMRMSTNGFLLLNKITDDGVNVLQTTGSVSIGGSATLVGNLTFSGTARRITGDFSNATVASRVLVQSNTTNGFTSLGLLPNGTSTVCTLQMYSNSADPANSSYVQMAMVGGTDVRFQSGVTGTGTLLSFKILVGAIQVFEGYTSNRLRLGPGAADEGTGLVQIGGSMYIANTTAPGVNPTAGGYMWVESGALKYRGSAGTITTLAPA